ncbi:MAG: metallophosphoesterase family protein [Promethearchaeota archaeon]
MIPKSLFFPRAEQSKNIWLINPNLGHPLFLNTDPDLKKREFEADFLFMSNIDDEKEVERILTREIQLIPILEYKWKIKKIIESKKREIEERLTLEKKEKRGLFSRLKRKFSMKKKKTKETEKAESQFMQTITSGIESLKEFAEEKFEKLSPRAMRGDSIPTAVLRVERVGIKTLRDADYIKNETCTPLPHFTKFNSLRPDLNQFYKVSINFDITQEVFEYLEDHGFIMFDVECFRKRINYHALVISKKDWQKFTFVQATDLHLAERNDRIYEIVKRWTRTSVKRNVDAFLKGVMKKLKIKKDEVFTEEFKAPLRKRFINPNNQFRKFIKLMNRKVLNNELDFIVLTGDLIDFTLLSKLFKSLKKITSFKFKHTNWKIFKDIILNSPHQRRYRGMIRGEELLCPIFTILGNHDYRAYHYDLTWAGLYRKMGLNASEAVALNEFFSASPITAIISSEMVLRGYFTEINPLFDYSLILGKNLFIFLNSGSDSFLNFRDLIAGHPSVTGLTKNQISYLENLIKTTIKKGMNVFFFVHGPPINTAPKPYLLKRNSNRSIEVSGKTIEDFKESTLLNSGFTLQDARIDDVFNVKFGTIASNWEKVIAFCKDYCTLTLAGHTHSLREYRLADPSFKTKIFDSPPFKLKRLEIPAAIYYDLYSELYQSPEEIKQNGPFVVQTPALGMGGYKNPSIVGAYREIVIKNGMINSFKVKYINR